MVNILESKILPYKFDKYQLQAIKNESKTLLINAGAGSGKTTTIIGRILYLLSDKNCDPNEILVLVFNASIAKEIRQKLADLAIKIKDDKSLDRLSVLSEKLLIISNSKASKKKIHTFHSYALSIARKQKDFKANTPDLAFRNPRNLHSIFEEVFRDNKVRKLIQTYFIDKYEFQNIFEDINSIKEYKKYIQPYGLTLQGENVRSMEELFIANYLLMKGVEYKYEDTYKKDSVEFRPDFHLYKIINNEIIYDVYYEHFALDKNLNPPKFFSEEEKISYLEGYRSKKKYFEDHNLNYFFSYSHQFNDQSIFDEIDKKLKINNITINNIDYKRAVEIFNKNNKSSRFIESIIKALDNYKINELNIDKMLNRNKELVLSKIENNKSFLEIITEVAESFLGKIENVFYSNKYGLGEDRETHAFIEIFEKFFEVYQRELEKLGSDFDDQILKAKESSHFIEENSISHCIVDEFQDISIPRAEIIRNIQKRNSNLFLFLVGDDWQAINGFAGSNYRIMTKMFEDFFGSKSDIQLSYTYRFNDGVCELTKNFIEKNKDQKIKNIYSFKGKYPKDLSEKKWNLNKPLTIKSIPLLSDFKIGMTLFHRDLKQGVIKEIKILDDGKKKSKPIFFVKFRAGLKEIDTNDIRQCSKIIIEKSFEKNILNDVKNIIDKIKDPNKTILFLHRMNLDRYRDGNALTNLYTNIRYYIGCKGAPPYEELYGGLFKKTEFRTVHRAKGLEADYVIIIKGHGPQGFPNSKKNDHILYPFLSHQEVVGNDKDKKISLERLKDEEDRRLFYVALTRSKNSTYIYSELNNKFISEIIADDNNKNTNIIPIIKIDKKIVTNHKFKSQKFNIKPSYQDRMKIIKNKNPNAYNKWTADEEKKLVELYKSNEKIEKIAQILKRQPGGIRSRIKKIYENK